MLNTVPHHSSPEKRLVSPTEIQELPVKTVSCTPLETPYPKLPFPAKNMTDPSCLHHLGISQVGRPFAFGSTATVFSCPSADNPATNKAIKSVLLGNLDNFPAYFNEKLIADSLHLTFSDSKLRKRFIPTEGWSLSGPDMSALRLHFSMPMACSTLENHPNRKAISKQEGITLTKNLLTCLRSAIAKGFVPADMNKGNLFFGEDGIMLGDFQKWGVVENSDADKNLQSAAQTIGQDAHYIALKQQMKNHNLSKAAVYKKRAVANNVIDCQINNLLRHLQGITHIKTDVTKLIKLARSSQVSDPIQYLDACLKYLDTLSDTQYNSSHQQQRTWARLLQFTCWRAAQHT